MPTSVFLDLGVGRGGESFTGQMIGPAADNTAAPPYSFTGDLTSGYASSAVGTLALVSGGTTRLSVSATAVTSAVPIVLTSDVFLRRSAAKTLTLDTDGAGGALTLVNVIGAFQVNGTFSTTAGAQWGWNTRAQLTSPANGQVVTTDNAATNGVMLDVTTDGVGWFKTRAAADTATLKANVLSTSGGNGQSENVKVVSTTVNAAAGSTISASNLIPAGATVTGVTTRVTTGFGVTNGLTSISVGDGTTADLWSHQTGITANTTTNNTNFKSGTWTGPKWYAAATSVVITGNGGTGFDATGVIRVSVMYTDLTAATS